MPDGTFKKMPLYLVLFLFISLQFLWAANNTQYRNYRQTTIPRISAGAQFNRALQARKINLNRTADISFLRKPSSAALDPQISGPVTEAINYARDDSLNGRAQSPPDNAGCVGPDHFLAAVNTAIEWYTKTDRIREYSESLNTFFAPTSPSDLFDPRVLWDQYNGRYVVIADEESDNDKISFIHIAVSKTSNPNDGWYFQKINTKVNINGTDTWLDFPSLGVSSEALYLSGNMFSFGSAYQATRLWIIDKGLYSGGTSSVSLYDPSTEAGLSSQAFTIQPAHMYGDQPGNVGVFMFSSEWDDNGGNNDLIALFRVDDPLGNSGGPFFTVDFLNPGEIHDNSSGVPEAPQKGSNINIDFGDDRAQSCVWRNSIFVGAFTVNPSSGSQSGQATNFWFTVNTSDLNAPVLEQQGLIEGDDIADNVSTGYPAVSINAHGDIVIGFAASADSIFAGSYAAFHEVGDASGSNRGSIQIHEGLDFYVRTGLPFHIGNRWGDYSSVALDPVNENNFWVFNQYAWTRGGYDPFADEDGRWATAFAQVLPYHPSSTEKYANLQPENFVLDQNYPNPFNPATTISYRLTKTGRVELSIYSVTGEKIRTLVQERQPAGYYSVKWEGLNDAGNLVTSGAYVYRLRAGNFVQVKKMILMR